MTRMAPDEPTEAMLIAGARHIDLKIEKHRRDVASDIYCFMLAASPGQGAVTAEQLEAAAEAAFEKLRELLGAKLSYSWAELPTDWRTAEIASQRAALLALGLQMEPTK